MTSDRACPRTGLPVHLCECTTYVADLSAPISADVYAWCHDTATEREAVSRTEADA